LEIKNNKTKSISFFSKTDMSANLSDPPVVSKSKIPDWYRSLPRFLDGNKLKVKYSGETNNGIKSCSSFFDAMAFGYMITTFCDINIEIAEDGNHFAYWSSTLAPLSPRPYEVYSQLPNPPGFGPFNLAIELTHGFVVPKGYSVIVTQPFNHYELNTFLSTGIIDADTPIQPGGIPFAVREGFEGTIPAGTPIAQIIPFKRDNWKSEIIEDMFRNNSGSIPRNYFTGWYKKKVWKKKEFS
jgi:hypothetical protein